MNIPNLITIFRLFLIPIFLLVFHSNMVNNILYGGLIFILAGISDVLDGYIARRYNQTTKLGTFLDPFADKLMSFAVLISFTMKGLIPMWVLIPILIKEVLMIIAGLTMYFRKDRRVIPANRYGKLATVFLYSSIMTIVFKLPENIIRLFLIITLLINIVAFYNYLKIYLRK
ncbi:CDP-diacylglycerol--glycerol-3-phosphate 3-phosphatidyltransferase [Tissierella creatinini]|nr:CDP-diacylglycerol--glycerol-3-phosphate 3-phosphatidyltransferase [Tissierella creatinini]TJX66677.1 CDP-diacylglycerol--glycerol-3-phosphate 3-phosphatidyltransferase [Soehngenia saccharolytica]